MGYVVLVEVCKENLTLQKYVVKEGRHSPHQTHHHPWTTSKIHWCGGNSHRIKIKNYRMPSFRREKYKSRRKMRIIGEKIKRENSQRKEVKMEG